MGNWLTNDPKAAKALKRADREYETARALASDYPLAEKIEAFRKARQQHLSAYDAVLSATRYKQGSIL